MNERMTNEEAERDDKAILAAGWKDESGNSTAGRIRRDWLRARASEDQKEATIKALADALWDARQYGDEPSELCWCQAPCAGMDPDRRNPRCEAKVETLRLAGRL